MYSSPSILPPLLNMALTFKICLPCITLPTTFITVIWQMIPYQDMKEDFSQNLQNTHLPHNVRTFHSSSPLWQYISCTTVPTAQCSNAYHYAPQDYTNITDKPILGHNKWWSILCLPNTFGNNKITCFQRTFLFSIQRSLPHKRQ